MSQHKIAAQYLAELAQFDPLYAFEKIASIPFEFIINQYADDELTKLASENILSELYNLIVQTGEQEKTAEEVLEEIDELPEQYLAMLEELKSAEQETEKTASKDKEASERNNPIKEKLIRDILEKKAQIEALDARDVLRLQDELKQKSIPELTKMAHEMHEQFMHSFANLGEPTGSGMNYSASDPLTEFLLSKANL